MADPSSWRGDWHARIYERARAIGFATVSEFAEARPLASTVALAEELGPGDVNAVQVTMILREEAEAGRFVERFARDLMVRKLRQGVPEGWPAEPTEEFELRLTATLVNWSNDVPDSHAAFAERVLGIVQDAEPPAGWLPAGTEDPVLLSFFAKAASRAKN